MLKDRHKRIKSKPFGIFAFLRKKQWWSFEGLDQETGLYYLVLALNSAYSSYISLKLVDYKKNKVFTKNFFGELKIDADEVMTISSQGKGRSVHITGKLVNRQEKVREKWRVQVNAPEVNLNITQEPEVEKPHRTAILTRRLNYNIIQYINNRCQGTVKAEITNNKETAFSGYGYCEHCWGIQPRQSTAHWLHFWGEEIAGVVLNCYYDAGTPHHYTLMQCGNEQEHYLFSPAQFRFNPGKPGASWKILSPDLELNVTPFYLEHNRLRIPPVFPFIRIDYYEQLVKVEGKAIIRGESKNIEGIGKYDHNFNFW